MATEREPIPSVFQETGEPQAALHEVDPYTDTMACQLDRAMQLIEGTQAWFEEHPQFTHFTFTPPTPMDDPTNTRAYRFHVTRETLHALREVALTRYMDVAATGELGTALARDIVKSWQKPQELIEGEERTL